jgi:muconate cycloisomerase
MKIVAAQLFALRIPFVEAFAHSIRSRTYSDSIVVRVEAEDGTVGYGEAVARPYVTGETVDSCLECMADHIWPAVQLIYYSAPPDHSEAGLDWLKSLSATLPSGRGNECDGVVAWNAARTGWELALVDCLLKSQGKSLADLLPPKRSAITYSGVITSSSPEAAVKMAKRFKQFGLPHLKVKITGTDDQTRIAAIREAVGDEPSIRLDGNGAYSVDRAIATCQELAQFRIDSAEQMIPRGNPVDLAHVQASSPIPQMADESLITLADAQALIDANACQWFNLRISKCGGLVQTVAIARLAEAAGIRLQLGCQVGETAILSAAGRHLAAYLPVEFVEGSYGKLLLSQDISRTPIQFGNRGRAPLLKRPGLGIDVQDALLETYAHQQIHLTAAPPR